MHIIRSRRFSPVRFWHLGLLLIVVVGWFGVGVVQAQNAIPRPTPVLTHLVLFPDYSANNNFVVTLYRWNPASATIAAAQAVKVNPSQVFGIQKEVSPVPIATPAPRVLPRPTTTPKPTAISTPKPAAPIVAPADLESLFQQHAATHGVNPEIMKKIAQCESGMRANANNGPYGGMFQFVASTWVSNRRVMGKDTNPALRFNAAEAIETAAFKMGRDGYGAWPACSRKALAST